MEKTKELIKQLDEYLWGRDVPSPTVPEYVELHDIVSTARLKLEKIYLSLIEEENKQ